MSKLHHREVIESFLIITNLGNPVTDEKGKIIAPSITDSASAKFKYGLIRNMEKLKAEVKTLKDTLRTKADTVLNAIAEADKELLNEIPEKNKKDLVPGYFTLLGLYSVELSCGSTNEKLNEKIKEIKEEHKELITELQKFLNDEESPFVPYKINLDCVPDALDIGTMEALDKFIIEK